MKKRTNAKTTGVTFRVMRQWDGQPGAFTEWGVFYNLTSAKKRMAEYEADGGVWKIVKVTKITEDIESDPKKETQYHKLEDVF